MLRPVLREFPQPHSYTTDGLCKVCYASHNNVQVNTVLKPVVYLHYHDYLVVVNALTSYVRLRRRSFIYTVKNS